jgi:protein translocase subunit secF/protein translocase subunit secD
MKKRNRLIAFFLLVIIFAVIIGTTSDKIVKGIKLGLDLQGGFEVLYEVKPVKEGDKITQQTLSSTADALDRRINVLGVSEPRIDIEEGNRIRVQLAGVKDQEQAREILSTTAELSFRDVNDNKLLDGTDLVEGAAKQSYDENGKPNVVIKLKDAKRFYEATKKVLQTDYPVMVIWLDFEEGVDSFKEEAGKENPKYISAPLVKEPINSDEVQITGNFTVEEAQTLASLLNAGALPVKLQEIYSTSVGAQFGVDALQKTVLAGSIGVLLIFLFLIVFYQLPGLVASIGLSVYIYLTLAIYNGLHAVLTLPGIAALLLGIGMAVDANIITYERIREELRVGRSLSAAYNEANKTSFITILDANLTTLLAGAVMFYFGTSSVKGFATMLIVSILVSFLTAIYLSHFLLGLFVKSGYFDHRLRWFGVKPSEVRDLKKGSDTFDLPTKFDRIDFVKTKKWFLSLSGAIFLAGILCLFLFGLNRSIDFTSGSRIEILANQSLTTEEIQADFQKYGIETNDIVLSGQDHSRATIRYKGVLDPDTAKEFKDYIQDKYGNEPSISVVTPTVGKELVKNAILSIIIASIGMILYVAFRFEWKMAVAAILALIHDAFLMVAVFSFTRLEVDLNFIAAVLTIIGYSINDTIVTFDRIREYLRRKRIIRSYSELETIVNRSIRQVFSRSVNTSITTLMPVVLLLLMGSKAIWNFSFAMLIGLVSGVYSTLFIASQLWIIWKGRELKKKGKLVTYKPKKRYFTDQPQV